MEDEGPDEAQDEFQLAVHDVRRVDVHQSQALRLEKAQGNVHVLELLTTEGRLLVVSSHLPS